MIEVILLERVDRLGQMGQVVKVRPGFARNFLLPHKKALRATKANLELFEKQRATLEAKNAADRSHAETEAAKLDNLVLLVIRQASETGQLYGSVSARDVAEAAKEAGHTIERMHVYIDSPIKSLGLFPVKIKLHPEVTFKVTINVARSSEEAVAQAEKNAATSKASAEKAEVEAAFGAPAAESASEAPKKGARKAKAKPDAEEATEAEKPAAKAKKPRAKKAAEG